MEPLLSVAKVSVDIAVNITTTAAPNNDGSLTMTLANLSVNIAFTILNILLANVSVGLVSLMGIVTNLVTIFILSRQLNESMNITFLGMAISDLCVAITALWFTICSIMNETNPPNFIFEPLSFIVMTAIIPRLFFINATSWLTAVIAVIRCLCVVLPFKVGILFTPKRTAIITTTVFSIIVFCYGTAYFRNEFVLMYFPGFNVTRYIMIEISKGQVIDDLVYFLGFVAMPFVNIFIVIFCTLTLIIKVKASSNWRQKAHFGKSASKDTKSGTESKKESNTKESRLTKLIIAITTTFIACNVPNNLVIMTRMLEPEFTERGFFKYTFIIVHDIVFLLETVNSSVSLFIFYNMSSKFKAEVHRMWPFLAK